MNKFDYTIMAIQGVLFITIIVGFILVGNYSKAILVFCWGIIGLTSGINLGTELERKRHIVDFEKEKRKREKNND